jgi:hypothetical protein
MNIVTNLYSCVTEIQSISLTNSRTLCEGLYYAWDNENYTEFPILLENKRIWGTTYADGETINGSFKLFPNSLYF